MILADHHARCLALETEHRRLSRRCGRLRAAGGTPYAVALIVLLRKGLEWDAAARAWVRAAEKSATEVPNGAAIDNDNAVTCGDSVSEGGLEPPCPFRGTSTSS